MALADEIEELVRRQPGLADLDLVRMLHDRAGSQQQIKSTCRRLVAEGRIGRQGRGGWGNPFTYYPPEDSTPRAQRREANLLPVAVAALTKDPLFREPPPSARADARTIATAPPVLQRRYELAKAKAALAISPSAQLAARRELAAVVCELRDGERSRDLTELPKPRRQVLAAEDHEIARALRGD
jgi:hypothetical protein